MKKTLIALLALASSVYADTYIFTGENYDGSNKGWLESKRNWTNAETNEKFGSGNDSVSADDVKNTFIIQSGKSAAAGTGTYKLEGAKVIVEKDATLLITTNIGNANIIVEDGGSLRLSDDRKLSGTVITTNSAVTIGTAWFDGATDCGSATFNLGSNGVINYGTVTHNANAWRGTLTLSASCSAGYLTGNGEIQIFERKLITASEFKAAGNSGSTMELVMNHVKGGDITLGGTALEYTSEAFDVNELTKANVGQYTLVYDNNSIVLQYAAYAVPEPTTATLSLLALCGLAARRRRK